MRLAHKVRNYLTFWNIVFVVSILFTFFANALHESYPDEFDNILGGWNIIHGHLPYTSFFTHHGPFPYFLSGFLLLFSGQSFVRFRLVYAVFLIVVLIGSFVLLRKRIGKDKLTFYPLFVVFFGIMSTYYWMQMILADNIAALAFLPVYILILSKSLWNKKVDLKDITIVSLFTAIGLYSSLTFLYFTAIIYISILYLYFKNEKFNKSIFSIKNFKVIGILLAPHFVFLIYLLATGSFGSYIYQNFTYNAKYYIYNYPRPVGSEHINPIRFAVIIANNFIIKTFSLLIGVKTFDFAFPINMTLLVGNVSMMIYLLLNKRYKLTVFVFLLLIYSVARSDPEGSGETDYQAALYNMLSFFNIFFVLSNGYKFINSNTETAKKVIASFTMLILGTYFFFSIFYLVMKFDDKAVAKYMGKAALIYDRPQVAPVINAITSKNDYAWIGPFSFEDLFYMNAKVPSKYDILIYGIGASDKLRAEMLSDFTAKKPIVVYMDRNFNYLSKNVSDYGSFLLDFLDKNYITLYDYKDGGTYYRSISSITQQLDLERNLYIRKDKIKEIIDKLLKNHYINSKT